MKNWCKRASDLFFYSMFLICLTASAFGQNMFRKTLDFDGDGKADFAVTRNIGASKYWYIWQSSQGFRVVQWGIDADENAPGDYDGDGKFDVAVFRQTRNDGLTNYAFWVSGSQMGTRVTSYQTNTYTDVVGCQQDYDGDGKTDVAWTALGSGQTRCGIWFSSGSGEQTYEPLGTWARLGDLNGDGKAEAAGVQLSTNLILRIKNSASNSIQTIQFGKEGDQFVAADFDGDGKGDLAVFRQSDGTWWWMRSSDGVINAAQFGQTGDKPVPADYDGDGKTDLAIWRPGETQSVYWVYGSTGNIMGVPFGIATDKVVTY